MMPFNSNIKRNRAEDFGNGDKVAYVPAHRLDNPGDLRKYMQGQVTTVKGQVVFVRWYQFIAGHWVLRSTPQSADPKHLFHTNKPTQ